MSAFDKMREGEGSAAEALALLRPLLEYDPLSGNMVWRKTVSNRPAGTVAGSLHCGYLRVKVKHRSFFIHRLAWLFTYGEWPVGQIDHKDGVRSNNRLNNLREVTHRENASNTAKHRDGKVPGIRFEPRGCKWVAQIKEGGIRFHLGTFDTAAEAAFVYQMALKDLAAGYEEMESRNENS